MTDDQVIARLKSLSDEEKTEFGRMKCRIDDQARLIMILKKRNDDYLQTNIALEKHSVDLEREIELYKREIEDQTCKETIINELRSTIEQLRSSLEFWKSKHDKLERDLSSNDDKHRSSQTKIEQLQEKIAELDQREQDRRSDIDRMKSDYDDKLRHLHRQIEEKEKIIVDKDRQIQNLTDDLRLNKASLDQVQVEHRVHIDEMKVKLERVRCELQSKQSLIQEINLEKDQTHRLLNEKDRTIEQLRQKFIIEEERVNLNQRVLHLQDKLNQTTESHQQLQQEFAAYQNYTNSIIQKEKQLNERLKSLLNGRTN